MLFIGDYEKRHPRRSEKTLAVAHEPLVFVGYKVIATIRVSLEVSLANVYTDQNIAPYSCHCDNAFNIRRVRLCQTLLCGRANTGTAILW